MSDTSTAYIRLSGLRSGYKGKQLSDVPLLEFHPGEFTAIVGRNGVGKSTILRIIAGLLKPLEGEVCIGGKPLHDLTRRELAEQVSFVSTDDVRGSNLKVRDVVGLGRAPYTNWIGYLSTRDILMIAEALEQVGMSAFAEKSVATLSDGERQRVMIARALAQDTPIILLDEPTAYLDMPNKYEISLLLQRLSHERGKLILFSTHDLSIALQTADRIAVLHDGGISVGTPGEMLHSGGIQRIFEGTSLEFEAGSGGVRMKKR